jgi:DNA-binding GntR family transcriptional regulator
MPSLAPVTHKGTVDIIAHRIRERIVDGTFAPGTQLGEANLAGQLQVSRGPVREALQRLIQEGLLRNIRNRGVFVAELEDADIDDIALARSAVEKTAAAKLARSPDPQVLDQLEDLVARMREVARRGQWNDLVGLDIRFHEALVGALGSKRLGAFYETLVVETRMSLSLLEEAYPQQEEIADEHQQLIDAIRSGRPAYLNKLIDGHLDHSSRRRLLAESRSRRRGGTPSLRALKGADNIIPAERQGQ